MITSKALFSHLPSQFSETSVKVLVTQWCPTLCDPIDYSLPGSSAHGILQATILMQVVMPPSRGSSNPGIKPASPALQADSLPLSYQGSPRNILHNSFIYKDTTERFLRYPYLPFILRLKTGCMPC